MAIPLAPTNVILQTGNGQNLLSWNQASGISSPVSYIIYRSTDGVNFSQFGTTTGSENFKIDATVSVGTQYWYAVLTNYYRFLVSSANATEGAVYTNNGHSYTVLETIASGTNLNCSGNGLPSASGTLTKSSGVGDSTITFSAVGGPTEEALSYSSPASITPCLPGQINLGYLRYMAQLESDQINGEFLTTDEWNFNINQSAFELYDLLVTKYGEDYFLAPPLIISLTGQTSYALPNGSNYLGSLVNGVWIVTGSGTPAAAMYKLSGIDANISGAAPGPNAGWVPLSRANWSDRDRYTTWPAQAGALNNIYQMSYRDMGNNLFIFPVNSNQLIQMWYVPILAQMLFDTDMLPFSISGWSEYVIVDAALKAARKEESWELVQELKSDKAILMKRIEDAAANRDVGQPNATSNVRAVMGDPGFSNWGNGFGGGGFGGGWGGF